MARYRGTMLAASVALGLVAAAGPAAQAAEDIPYVVTGNQHILIGVTLDEEAVRAALPEGLEPAEGMTGGVNLYTSTGGEGVDPYDRCYVWVDLVGFDSITGNKGRYILWIAGTSHLGKMERLGYRAEAGETAVTINGTSASATTSVGGEEVITAMVEFPDDACGPARGSLNYPSVPVGADGMPVTQYLFAAEICGATPVSVEFSAPADHTLSTLKPELAGWAAVARELSFAASPAMALPKAD